MNLAQKPFLKLMMRYIRTKMTQNGPKIIIFNVFEKVADFFLQLFMMF